MPETTPKLGLPIPPGGDSSIVSRDLRAALLGLDAHICGGGIINLTASFAAAAANTGTVQVHRVGGVVAFTLSNFIPATSGRNITVGNIPVGYRPAFEQYGPTAAYWSANGPIDDVRITFAGNVIVQTVTEGAPIQFNITYTTADPLPA